MAELDGGSKAAKETAYDALLGAIARQADPPKRELRLWPSLTMVAVAAVGAFCAYGATNWAIASYQDIGRKGNEVDGTFFVIVAIAVALGTIITTLILGRFAYVDTDAPRYERRIVDPILNTFKQPDSRVERQPVHEAEGDPQADGDPAAGATVDAPAAQPSASRATTGDQKPQDVAKL